ncbi:MAG TPA: YdeI/OmpD-associated family protein [Vicinamibacterales bacterium]|nr:YdeI/OmpD-associated family protein [Vicinamibacterales bacterium]
MGKRDERIDAYIDNAQPFAKPILRHLREIVHRGCPEVEETMKWSFPHFTHKGILCSMASFKQHCVFGFWKAALLTEKGVKGAEAMGQYGRITSVADLPPDAQLVRAVKEAAALNEQGVRTPARRKPERARPARTPTDLLAALRRNRHALATFQAFSSSHRREYIEWIVEAKGEDTRKRRVASAVEWMAAGKPRNWKYMARAKAGS